MLKKGVAKLGLMIGWSVFWMLGCASKAEFPYPLEANLVASVDANLDSADEPSPVVLTFYQLADDQAFSESNYQQLMQQPSGALSAGLLKKKKLYLSPGKTKTIELDIVEQARYLAVVAGFSRAGTKDWRQVVALPEKKGTKYKVDVMVQGQKVVLFLSRR